MLRVRGLKVFYGRIQAVKGISFHVHRGETVAFIGPNGAGKSSVLMALSGVTRKEGEITLEGRDISRLSPYALVKEGIVQVPEGRQVFSSLTVEENLLLGGFSKRGDKKWMRETMEWVYHLFPLLAERRKQLAGSLSGGEQQMLALGRALMGDPRLLLLDEPSLGLAPVIVEEIYKTLKELRKERSMSIILVEQNAPLALEFAHRAYVMESGAIVLSGETEMLLSDDTVLDVYLGRAREDFFD
ncbi:MAG: ABC transporter ATP-binding protein [Aquificota bacterium]|nr:MAG: ABC transporter ATP-binding protein [Aquificota bacterium]RLD99726.1 MAG: ABC transporter ATP-binding protein [Aquificota bacterium]